MSKKNRPSLSRRNFIRNTSLSAAGFLIVPRHVLGRGFVAPSDTLLLAAIGSGGMGESGLNEFSKSPNVKVSALCDVSDKAAANSKKKFAKAPYYKDFRDMLSKEKNNIDEIGRAHV